MLTLEQIRREGLEALQERLGRAGMIRFLAQFDNGSGDYAKDRHEWVDRTSLADIRQSAQSKTNKEAVKLLIDPLPERQIEATKSDADMNIELFSEVALARDVPEEGLRRGDVATVVEKLPGTEASGGEGGYALEVFNAIGGTIAVVTVPVSAVEPLRASEVLSVRTLQQSD